MKTSEDLADLARCNADKYQLPLRETAIRAYIEGFVECQNSIWHDFEKEQPQVDGDYIILLKTEESCVVEIAPWRDKEYNGGHKMAVYFNNASIVAWQPITFPQNIIEKCYEN